LSGQCHTYDAFQSLPMHIGDSDGRLDTGIAKNYVMQMELPTEHCPPAASGALPSSCPLRPPGSFLSFLR
jgi:hypothetical protein